MNPYKNLQDYQFWRRSVSSVEFFNVDPVTHAGFTIGEHDKIATAGSCFAQHIARALSAIGLNYFVPEDGQGLDEKERRARNYGVFSARYGNIYTTAQLRQLIEEAFYDRQPEEAYWVDPKGRYIDSLRPNIEPDGFADLDALRASREEHLRSVKRVFEEMDVFVFTMGLTEGWRSKSDGTVFPVAPGVRGGSYEEAQHEFVNFPLHEIEADMQFVIDFIAEKRPGCKIILTVSPVPLVATYEDRHVMVSTTYSKSVLRVAAETITQNNDNVDYFPSYEMITGPFHKGKYYEDDLREVKQVGVNHVMRTFIRHYVEGGPDAEVAVRPEENADAVRRAAKRHEEDAVICDEELLDV